MDNRFQNTRNTRRESRTLVGRFRAGRLAPVLATAVRGNEGGMLSQQITLRLDPIAGELVTPAFGEFISVFVPVQAIDALKYPDADFAGLTEVIREKLLSGNPLFGLESESECSKRCGINPRSIGGQKRVSEMVRLAHNCAVNHLRRRKYVKATLLTAAQGHSASTPALISQTVLERMNGVLDPDDRINGAVQLDIPNMQLPVTGIGLAPAVNFTDSKFGAVKTAAGDASWATRNQFRPNEDFWRIAENPDRPGYPYIFAQLNGAAAGGVSLTDFYNAEKMDGLTRTMRKIVDDNSEYGEEMVLRWAHGLAVDTGKVPFVIHEQRQTFGRQIVPAMDTDGVTDDVQRSDMALVMEFTVPVPRTELGGVIVTFSCLKPDETISGQPHPFLSDNWGVDNFVADELALDPVPVTIRELDADCTAAQENTVALYTGLNQLKAMYVSYGLSRQLDPNTVANKTAVWQLNVPLSVTPDSILYPVTISQYPFQDQNAEVCTYVVTSNLVLQTPMIIGPTPVEELAIIGDADIFEQE